MAAGNTYEAIATQTLGSDTSSITFSSISASYTDLILVVNGGVVGPAAMLVQLNGDTSVVYSVTRLYGDGSSATSDRFNSTDSLDLGYFNNDLNNSSFIHFMNYSNTTTNKSVINRWNSTTYVVAVVGLWRNTSAINSIRLFNATYNLKSGSTFSLYGIKAA